jgi:long-subunit fatty acid transport protein
LGESYSVTVGGDLNGEAFRRLTGLNNASLDGTISLKKKWGLGAFAPWARAGVSVGRSSYDDSYRNAWNYRATLASGRRIDERWNLWAEYAFDRRAASPRMEEVPGLSGDAFSQDSHNVAVNLEYSLNESTFLALGLLGRRGDVVSTTGDSEKTNYAPRALAADPAFGPEAYAYKLTGTTYGFRVGVNYAPTPHSLLGLGFERLNTHADGGNSYTKSVPEITWDYRF